MRSNAVVVVAAACCCHCGDGGLGSKMNAMSVTNRRMHIND